MPSYLFGLLFEYQDDGLKVIEVTSVHAVTAKNKRQGRKAFAMAAGLWNRPEWDKTKYEFHGCPVVEIKK